jgi:DNA-binding NtrC family response regulator
LFARVLWIVERLSDQPADMPPRDMIDSRRFDLSVEQDALNALCRIEHDEFDVIIASFPLPDWDGEVAFLEELQRVAPTTPVVIHSPDATVHTVVRLMQAGAFHVLQNEDPSATLMLAARSKSLRNANPNDPWRRYLVGDSSAMQRVVEAIRLVAPHKSTVLVNGETGTGKEMVARAIHAAGTRAHLPMVSVNCTAFPETLLEAELFGHVKGAFTGATANRVGRFEQANRGTVFLDEIGDMPLNLQSKLLRVLQEREFQRLGSSETVRIDVRVIAATNVDLTERIKDGRFREDLYYRLNVVPIAVPPLRDRGTDIPVLARYFLDKICLSESLTPKYISPEALRRLSMHDWPGNVRQLENAVEKAAVLSGDRPMLCPADFQLPPLASHLTQQHHASQRTAPPFIALPEHGLDFEQTVDYIQRNILEQALRKTKGNKKAAAQMLGLKRTTLSAKLKSLTAMAS